MKTLTLKILKNNAQQYSAAPAVISDSIILTHQELYIRVEQILHYLEDIDIPSNINVALRFKDPLKHLSFSLSLYIAGVCQTPIDYRETQEMHPKTLLLASVGLIIQDFHPNDILSEQTIIVSENWKLTATSFDWDKMQPSSGKDPLQTYAQILIGSGTTGEPKAFYITSDFLAKRIVREAEMVNLQPLERFYCFTSLHFLTGIDSAITALLKGVTVILPVLKPKSLISFCIQNHIDHLSLTSSQALQLLNQNQVFNQRDTPLLLPNLKSLTLHSAPISDSLRYKILDTITDKLFITYGTNEFGECTIAYPKDIRRHPGTVGKTFDDIQLSILDDHGQPCPIGVVGNIVLHTLDTICPYINNHEANKKTFKQEGYYPGDIGRLTEDGNLIFEGRKDDMMIFTGVNIYPREMESVLESHPAVVESAVFPLKIMPIGDIPFAVVSTNIPVNEAELLQWCSQKLGWKIPQRILFIDKLPQNRAGKILKKILLQKIINTLKNKSLLQIGTRMEHMNNRLFLDMQDFVTFFLDKNANELPSDPAIICDGNFLTHLELRDEIHRTISSLEKIKLSTSTIVALRIQDPIKHMIYYISLLQMGICQISINPKDTLKLQQIKLSLVSVDLIIQDISCKSKLMPQTLCIDEDHELLTMTSKNDDIDENIVYSNIIIGSGTTGDPKVFRLQSSTLVNRVIREADVMPYKKKDRFFCHTTLYYAGPKNDILGALYSGVTVVTPSIHPKHMIQFCLDNQINHISLTTNQALLMLTQEKMMPKTSLQRLPDIKSLSVMSSIITESLRKKIMLKLTDKLYIQYGTNEFGDITLATPEDILHHPGTVGRAYPNVSVSIVDDNGNTCSPGVIGNILVHSLDPLVSYINNPEANKKTFKQEGYYPGDIGRLTEDGNLIFEGRKDDMMIFWGSNIYPREIESVLESHPLINEAAAFPLSDYYQQDVPIAVVSTIAPTNKENLRQWCSQKLGWKSPQRIFFIDVLPRNDAGKVLKRLLSEKVIEVLKGES